MLATSDDRLRRDIRRLGAVLGEVIRNVAGDATFELVEEVRALSRARRRGDSEAEVALANRVRAMSTEEANYVTRAFSIFFDLANSAEERHRARVLRDREKARYPRVAVISSTYSCGGLLRERLTQITCPNYGNLITQLELVFSNANG